MNHLNPVSPLLSRAWQVNTADSPDIRLVLGPVSLTETGGTGNREQHKESAIIKNKPTVHEFSEGVLQVTSSPREVETGTLTLLLEALKQFRD